MVCALALQNSPFVIVVMRFALHMLLQIFIEILKLIFEDPHGYEVKDNGDKAELLNHTFVSHFNTEQISIDQSH